MKNKNQQSTHPLEAKLNRISHLLEQLIAVQMYKGGATQPEIAENLDMALGKINRLVKGVKAPRENHGKKD